MALADADRDRITAELGREPTPAEAALFENLWSEHCAYRSSRPLLSAFDSTGAAVVVGPGDDAAVVAVPAPDEDPGDADTYLTMGIESHNHPSYVDPFDGAATGVGGIVRDTMSMGAYPIALADCLYFGAFEREHARYLFEGVVEGISHYGNCIGVPTVTGSVAFHEGYAGNPLVNVACLGLTDAERLVTAEAESPGNRLVLVGNATGRDGLGGASFASEDLSEDAETEDRPAVQVGDPYTEKLLIECNERLLDEELVVSARDLGAAGLGGATSEMVAKGGLGARIDLDRVHQREPGMNAVEILLSESQERMAYEVRPDDVDRVRETAGRYDLGCSVVGEVTDGNYVCTFGDRSVVDVDAEFLGDGAPMNDLPSEPPARPHRDLPDVGLSTAVETVLAAPNTASKRWVYRQYDHEVGARTARRPGDDAAVLAVRETTTGDTPGTGLAFTAGADPNWTDTAPYDGARGVALENATNLAAKGADPLAAVNCLNGGNPETPGVYGGFERIVEGLADMCAALSIPVVGGNVSLYNDSSAGPVPPTPTLAMTGTRAGYEAPPLDLAGEGTLVLVGDRALANATEEARLGGSELLARAGGSDRYPKLPTDPAALVETVATVADWATTLASHDVSHGGLAVSLAEMIHQDAGADVSIDAGVPALLHEQPGRVILETTDPDRVREAFTDVAPVRTLGGADDSGVLSLSADETLALDAETVREHRGTVTDAFD